MADNEDVIAAGVAPEPGEKRFDTGEPAFVVQQRELGSGLVQPYDRLLSKIIMSPPSPQTIRLRNRTILEDDAVYHAFRYVLTQITNQAPVPKVYQFFGDHLYVAEVNTDVPVYVKLGTGGNPFFRIKAGQVIHRKFTSIMVTHTPSSSDALLNINQDVLFYVSSGSMFEHVPEVRYGLTTANFAASGTATTTPTDFLNLTGGGTIDPDFQTAAWCSAGKAGGGLIIKNTDSANTLLVAQGFPLAPGESLTFDLSTRFSSKGSLRVFCAVGTCAFAFILWPFEFDSYDVFSPLGGSLLGG